MKRKTDLSVVILSYNTKTLLKDCLLSVSKAGKKTQIIVVDNASSDGSSLMVKKNFPEVKLIQNQRNLGFAAGNNLGLKQAVGRYILFLNSDTLVKPNVFERLIKFLDKHPAVGALTPKTLLVSGKMDPDCHRGFPTPWASISYFLGLEKLFPRSRIFGRYHKLYLDLNKIHPIDAGAGAFLLVRRKAVEQIGGWDERYFFYGEDLDFFYRLHQADWQVVFYPEPLVIHYKGASSGLRKETKKISLATKETRLKTAKASIKAMQIFYKKFYQDKYPRWLTWLVILAIKVKGVFRILQQLLKK